MSRKTNKKKELNSKFNTYVEQTLQIIRPLFSVESTFPLDDLISLCCCSSPTYACLFFSATATLSSPTWFDVVIRIGAAVESRKDSRTSLTQILEARSERSMQSCWDAVVRTLYSVAVSKSAFFRMFRTVSSIFLRLLHGISSMFSFRGKWES